MNNKTALILDLLDCIACGQPHEKAEIQKLLMPIYSDGVTFTWGYDCGQHDLETLQGSIAIVQVLLTDEDVEKARGQEQSDE